MCKYVKENKITFQFDSVSDFVYNVFSVKNVYFARYKDQKVVLKKLAHQSEFEQIKLVNYSLDLLKGALIGRKDYHPPFCICNDETFNFFLKSVEYIDVQHLYTILSINVEPILLQLFSVKENFPFPHFYGFCGRLAIEENCGEPLNNIENHLWFDRAYVAYQILQAAKNFTESHSSFRLYLTDISPDNIVVGRDLKVSFIDLENAVLRLKTKGSSLHTYSHYTKHLEDSYYYSQSSLCDHHISDHNIYGVCMLLLSKNSMWPMMQGGLLHHPPKIVLDDHKRLLDNIELCVHSENEKDRFELSDVILQDLKIILHKYFHNLL
ncbi:hypothetical protein JTB14_004668 [Gonioctena quinquepunctata]|nr:hypothetical protein JTB14_004668 [Gonioctena quinquepunctata]